MEKKDKNEAKAAGFDFDEDGYRYQLLYSIIDHKMDGKAIEYKDGWITSKNGRKTRRTTTKGWHFLVQWCDDGT